MNGNPARCSQRDGAPTVHLKDRIQADDSGKHSRQELNSGQKDHRWASLSIGGDAAGRIVVGRSRVSQ